MDPTLLSVQQELENNVKTFWENNYKNKSPPLYANSLSVYGNSLILIGMNAGLSIGIIQQTIYGLSLVAKDEKLPIFSNIKAVPQSTPQIFGRIIISGCKGASLGAIYGSSYFLNKSFNINESLNLFVTGIFTGIFGGILWRRDLLKCLSYGFGSGLLSLFSGFLSYSSPPTLRVLRLSQKENRDNAL